MSAVWTHATSYQGFSPAALIHRSRLRLIADIFRTTDLPTEGTLVDFGCSDGFIVQGLRRSGLIPDNIHVVGFDHAQPLIRLARRRAVENAEFHVWDLNEGQSPRLAEIVTCFETLEHVGNLSQALEAIVSSVAPQGRLIITVPNELRLVGLLKLGAHLAGRRSSARQFFLERSRTSYARDVLLGRNVSSYRLPPKSSWATHFGFDHRVVEKILDHCVTLGRLEKIDARWSGMHMNRVLVYAGR